MNQFLWRDESNALVIFIVYVFKVFTDYVLNVYHCAVWKIHHNYSVWLVWLSLNKSLLKVCKQLPLYHKLKYVVVDNGFHYFTSNVDKTNWLIITWKLFSSSFWNGVMVASFQFPVFYLLWMSYQIWLANLNASLLIYVQKLVDLLGLSSFIFLHLVSGE